MSSLYEDPEMLSWLRHVEKYGPSFLRALADAAFLADERHYPLLRPLLLTLKQMHPEATLTSRSRNHVQ